MNCPHCGRPVPEDAVFCGNCGGALLPSQSPGTPPPSSSGNRTLIIVLAAIVAALLLMTGVAAAFLIARRSESPTASSLTVVTEAPPATSVDAETTEPTEAAATTSEAVELASGRWVDTTVPQPPGESFAVAVSEDFMVISADSGLYAYSLTDKGELIKIDSGGTNAGSPTLDGSLVAWWEGSYVTDHRSPTTESATPVPGAARPTAG